jgi:hypothetical protein
MDELTPAQVQHLQRRVKELMVVEDRGHSTPCWISHRAAQSNGYTKLGYLGQTLLTHRVAYTVYVGAIPDGLVIDHLCRQRACCNPDHLEPVTTRVNLLRGEGFVAQQARRTHCPRDHALVGDNVYRRPDGSNRRECRTCRNTRRWLKAS